MLWVVNVFVFVTFVPLPGDAASVPVSIDGRLVSNFSVNASIDAGYKALRIPNRWIDMIGSISHLRHANFVLGNGFRLVEIWTDGSLVDGTARMAVRSSSILGISCNWMLVYFSGGRSSTPSSSSSSNVLPSLTSSPQGVLFSKFSTISKSRCCDGALYRFYNSVSIVFNYRCKDLYRPCRLQPLRAN